MEAGFPKFRSDLVVSEQTSARGPVFVVKDPRAARFFRLGEAEVFLARQLDGATPLDVVRRRVEVRFDAAVAPGTFAGFVTRLSSLGLLEEPDRPAPTPARPPSGLRGGPLSLRLKAVDPDRVLERLARILRFAFTPSCVLGSAAIVLAAAGVTLAHGADIARDLALLYRVDALALAWVTVLGVTSAHELAHGVTCKRFGGSVHEMGLLLIYFQPALYCDISDAWLFPEKSKRLWVTFAGAYLELVVWALATLVWRVSEPGTSVAYVALIIVATSGVRLFFNLNPLIKLDGYYLLSDYLDIPNLRQAALRYVRSCLPGAPAGVGAPAGAPEVTSRERRIYLTYGLLAGAYSFFLLTLFAWHLAGYLVATYQGIGFVVCAAALAGIATRVLRPHSDPTPATPGQAPASPQGGGGRHGPWVTVVGYLAGTALLGGVGHFGRLQLSVPGEFKILPAHNVDVRSELDGILEEIWVDEGDSVGAGEPVARLSGRDYRAALREVRAQVTENRARLRLLQAGARAEELELARIGLAKAEERAAFARRRLAMLESEPGLVSRKDLNDAREEAALREKEVAEAGGRLQLLLAGSRPEEIEAVQAAITRLEGEATHREEQLGLLDVVTPVAGVVTTARLKERVGRHVRKGDLITAVQELRVVTAEIAVSEKEIADVRIGAPVLLRARAHPGTAFEGAVTSIAPVVRKDGKSPAPGTVLVHTRLDNAALLLKPGMTGNAKIAAGKRRVLDLMTRRLARYLRVEFWSWW